MKDKILSVLKSYHGRGGYYGITPFELFSSFKNFPIGVRLNILPTIDELEKENKIYLTRSTQENNRGEIVLICYRPSGEEK